jgi:hypothetical protein
MFWTAAVTACALTGMMPQGAAAGTVNFTGVGTAYPDNSGIVDVSLAGAPDPQPWTTPITLYTGPDGTGTPIVVFCDDLFHYIYLGSSGTFNTGQVTTDSNGNTLTQQQSGTMGLLAQIGLADYRNGNMDGAIAAQAAIWAVEYGSGSISINTVYSGYSPAVDNAIASDFSAYMKLQYNGSSYAEGLIGTAGVQSQITGVPEPSTWAMMLLGFAGVGFAGYRRTKRSTAAFVAA